MKVAGISMNLTCHRHRHALPLQASLCCRAVDGDPVPVPHFGMALQVEQFHELAERVKEAGIRFIIEPHVRFEGEPPQHLYTSRAVLHWHCPRCRMCKAASISGDVLCWADTPECSCAIMNCPRSNSHTEYAGMLSL